MKISVELPSEIEDKWKRLLAVFGPEAEELMIAAVDCLWTKYRKSVESYEKERRNELANVTRVRSLLRVKDEDLEK